MLTEEQKKFNKKIASKKWSEKNKEKLKEYAKEWRKKNDTYIKEKRKENYKKNKNNIDCVNKNFYLKNKNNPEFINKRKNYAKIYYKNKREKDCFFRLKSSIRSIINQSLKKNNITKNSKTHKIIGCSYNELKIYLESKFESWMSWECYGNPKDSILELNKTWDIDHIVPLSLARNEEEILKLNHYTNLQPLCSYTNRYIKKNSIYLSEIIL